MEQFQGLRLSIGKLEKGIKSLVEDDLEQPLKDARKLEEQLVECAESVKYFQFWMEDKLQELDLAKLPFKIGDRVGWVEYSNRGVSYTYQVFRTGTLHKVTKSLQRHWNSASNNYEVREVYEYIISLNGKSKKTLKSDRADLLTLQDLEQTKQEYLEALEVMKSSVPLAKPRKTKKAK